MSSDYEYSDDDGDYYDDEEMIDGTQDDLSGASEDDMDMDVYGGDDFKVTPKGKRKSYEVDYDSLSQSAVEKLVKEDVDYICSICGVDESVASLLLRHMKWNKERLVEKYMDNPTSLLVAAGVTAPEPTTTSAQSRTRSIDGSASRRSTRGATRILALGGSKTKSPTTSPPLSHYTPRSFKPKSDEPFVCPICFDDSSDLRTLALDCEHTFCSGCWNAYLVSKIRDEGEHSVKCMAEGCALVCPDPFIRTVLVPAPGAPIGDPTQEEDNRKAWSHFQELLVRHYVASNKRLKFCPYPGCTNTVSCPSAADKSSLTTIVPTVSCGARGIGGQMTQSQSQSGWGLTGKEHKFCFGCHIESDHRPVVCSVARMWLKKCRDDSETANWIKSNTKECSQCQSTIEKNGGCNHMTCKKCKHEFCWVCMGPWSEHGTAWYSCNRYDEKAGVDARDAQSRSRASLERYLHYYNRWANHEQSAKLSLDLYAKTEKKMEDMQITSSLTWIEVQFMKKAVEEVERCRMTLKWTYSMAYYLAKGNEKDLFEDNQRDLEKAVEDLSELLEGPIEPENIPMLRQKVTDKTVYVQKRNEIVLEDTAKGFLEGRWKWNASVEGFDEPERTEY
ncbi:hypothetical protein P691DRAFT_727578 [Macrolepiota fuliginosa MF-IS2]|uniref:RBR-type E3 ubiquitin transferase n=1 Tax=Macrolepiota fuliginosa MF-IS2 TaxID=1400762 RepID=A0A9P5XH26_9AGAR|nr:hypothetical protein P691DRAFT_727578 [Macrolepiota fuliginosa MF-IS2]